MESKSMTPEKKIGDPSEQAIDFAKRMIALKWTREKDVDTVASIWQAGYVAAQMDRMEEIAAKDKEIERVTKLLEKNWKNGFYRYSGGMNPDNAWQEYKTENNL